ncbi:hypothetical protein DL771_007148 [Monosporascus sp. 5C6A]|nr:hypothetical protein DL771_007148 [Monosporascus sp. 5C6A]
MMIPLPRFPSVITASKFRKGNEMADKQDDSLARGRGRGATGKRPRHRNRTGAPRRYISTNGPGGTSSRTSGIASAPRPRGIISGEPPLTGGGYMLHGPRDKGKTSLSRPLAGVFGLGLYVLKMQSVSGDTILEGVFQELPPYCIVLLEDIDAVGMKRKTGDGRKKGNRRS